MSDVVVVGGGPAGSATALTLARAGVAVTLIERARFPRRKVCGEYQNSGAVAALDALGLRERVAATASELRGIRLVPPHAASVELAFSRPAFACDRAALDSVLLDAAVASGVEVVRGRVEGLLFDGGRATGVTYRDHSGDLVTQRARFVVGADGTGSVVARKLGVTLPPRGTPRFAIGGHYRGFGALDGFVEMHVGAGAYFAINPLDANRANVMVVVPAAALGRWSADVDMGVRGKAAELGRGRRSFAEVERIGARVSIGPLAHRVRSPIAAGAVLVGDAAGFLNPFTGQGVYLALSGAQAACTAILSAFTHRQGGYRRVRTLCVDARRGLSPALAAVRARDAAHRRCAARAPNGQSPSAISGCPARAHGRAVRHWVAAERLCSRALEPAAGMTVTSTSIMIAAPPATIYGFAAATQRWPLILPHYRYVRVHERSATRLIVEMAAWRDIFPLHWVAEQINDPLRPHIAFRHIAGPTRGMNVEWTFEPQGDKTRVTIVHQLQFAFPIFASFIGTAIVGNYFIAGVAERTLACMKKLAEAAARQ